MAAAPISPHPHPYPYPSTPKSNPPLLQYVATIAAAAIAIAIAIAAPQHNKPNQFTTSPHLTSSRAALHDQFLLLLPPPHDDDDGIPQELCVRERVRVVVGVVAQLKRGEIDAGEGG
jgi:hypothetical protein